jgi:hypothetical protein
MCVYRCALLFDRNTLLSSYLDRCVLQCVCDVARDVACDVTLNHTKTSALP